MTRRWLWLVAPLTVLAIVSIVAVSGATHDVPDANHRWYPGGSLAGGDYLYCPRCDLVGMRNIQGGQHTGNRYDLNLDIGAGSTQAPGDLVLNYDVGRCTVIYNGRKRKLAKFCPRGIVFYARPIIRKPPRP